MAYAVAGDVRVLTGWATGTISDADLGSMIIFADAYIDSIGLPNAGTSEKNRLSALYTAHLGELRLKGSLTNFNSEGMSVAYSEDTGWLKEFNKALIQQHGIPYRKSWGRR